MGLMDAVETHPVQNQDVSQINRVPKVVAMLAYEVYCELYGEQQALVTGGCRGGFGVNELVAFLYARTFPRSQWRARVDEAFTGMGRVRESR